MPRPLPLLLLATSGCWITGPERVERERWWHEVSAGYAATCGIRGSGVTRCWGEIHADPPDRAFSTLSAGYQFACGIDDGEIVCWGNPGAEGEDVILDEPAGDDWVQVHTLAYDVCAVDHDGELACWGTTTELTSAVPGGSYTKAVVGEFFACALGIGQDVTCWGQAQAGETSAAAGTFEDVDAADDVACGLADDGGIVCWGEAAFEPLSDGDFVDLAVGWNFVCGLDGDGKVTCLDQGDQPTLPAPRDGDVFVSIDAGAFYVCGVTDDGRAVCWGSNDVGETDVPDNPPPD